MVIYKKPIGTKTATFRQGFYWAMWGIVAGIYCWQPLLKISHRDEMSLLADYIQIADGKATLKSNEESIKGSSS